MATPPPPPPPLPQSQPIESDTSGGPPEPPPLVIGNRLSYRERKRLEQERGLPQKVNPLSQSKEFADFSANIDLDEWVEY